jgi:tetratricopeptide (TPR) repeat protein
VAHRLKDRHAEGNALNAIGTVWRGMGESRRAVGCYEEALAIAIDLGQGDSAARRGFNLALALNDCGDRAGACTHMREARERYAALQLPEAQDAQRCLAEWGCAASPA